MLSDLRYAWRQLRHSPGFFAAAVLTLGLGIGTTAAFFSIVDSVLLRPVPVADLDGAWSALLGGRPLSAGSSRPASGTREELRRLEAAAPASRMQVAGSVSVSPPIVQAPGQADRLSTETISGHYPDLFRLPVQAGRWIAPEDDVGAGRAVAVISDRIWRTWFGGRVDAVGATLLIDRRPYRIIGVAPPSFRGLRPGSLGITDVWVPIASWPRAENERFDIRATLYVRAPAGAPMEQVRTALVAAIAQSDAEARSLRAFLEPAVRQAEQSARPLRSLAGAAIALAVLILVAACANLGNLLFARGSQRATEVAVRLSLGATRLRVLRLFVAEACLVAGFATVAGLALAVAIVTIAATQTRAFRYRNAEVLLDLTPDAGVFGVALAAGAVAALVVGLVTAWRASRVPPQRTFAASGAPGVVTRRSRRLRTALVGVQVASAFLTVLSAGAFIENQIGSFATRSLDVERIHFDMTKAIGARVDLDLHGYDQPRGRQFLSRALDEARRLPGVRAAAIADAMPGTRLEIRPRQMDLVLDEADDPGAGSPRRGAARYLSVSPGFFAALDLPLVRGRDFGPADGEGTLPVAIVSESVAAALWPARNPIGKRLRYETGHVTVVGLVTDPVTTTETNPYSRPSNFVFVPIAQHHRQSALVVLRADNPRAQIGALRAALRSVDADVAVLDAGTIEESVYPHLAPMRAATGLMATLGAVALAIAVMGVYAVMAYFVSTRTREFGIRSALGATPGRVARSVMDEAVHVVLVGLLPGVLLAAWSSRAVQAMRSGFTPNSLSTWALVPILILSAGLVAAWLPARRAARVDPNVALREL